MLEYVLSSVCYGPYILSIMIAQSLRLCKQCFGHTLIVRLSNHYFPLGVYGVKMSKVAACIVIPLALDDEEEKEII